MIHYSSPEQIRAYEVAEGINQSLLKLLCKGVDYFNENLTEEQASLYFEEKEHFIIGTGVDCKITNQLEVFNQSYYVSEGNKPGDTIMSIVKKIYDDCTVAPSHDSLLSEDMRQSILDSVLYHNYQKLWKEDTKIDKIRSEGHTYWKELIDSQGKKILSIDQSKLINEITESLLTKTPLYEILKRANSLSEDIDVYYQFPVFFIYEGVQCKGLLDAVIVDHKKRTIRPLDIKTLHDYTINFPSAVRKRRYDFQAAFYTKGLSESLSSLSTVLGIDVTDYIILPFTFAVESTKRVGNPLLWVCTDRILSIGTYGCIEDHPIRSRGVEGYYSNVTLGYSQAIDLYKFHSENGFDKDRIVKENKGVLNLDFLGGYVDKI